MAKFLAGGYAQIDLSSNTIYNDLQKIRNLDKPVIIYDSNEGTPYFADSISFDSQNEIFTITKGGKTITITNANVVSSNGEIQPQLNLMENIKDENGNLRFIEGTFDITTIEGITKDYAKWSLSGSHLMIVLVLSGTSGSAISSYNLAALIEIPKWIYDKIYLDAREVVDAKNLNLFGSNWTTQSLQIACTKAGDNKLRLYSNNSSTFTLDADRSGRIQFDLLIDNE